jgi:nitrogen fixation protein NifU and related proteins
MVVIILIFSPECLQISVKQKNMSYSVDDRRKIILDNFKNPDKQLSLTTLKELNEKWKIPFLTFRNLEDGCGDILHLLVRLKNNCIEKIYFAGQQSCLITVSSSNILCSYLEGKDRETGRKIITNFQAMLKGENYCLDDYPLLKVFSDITHFSHRLGCINLVVKALIDSLYS